MNWGWGSSASNYNGWYDFDSRGLPDGENFQYGTDMVYNIHP